MGVQINMYVVLIAALVNYIIGAIWYGVIFGKSWSKMTGVSEIKPDIQNVLFGLLGAFLTSYILACVIVFANFFMKTSGITGGLICGFLNWLGFIAPVTIGSVTYEKKPWALWFINNGYWLLSLLIMGSILSVWK